MTVTHSEAAAMLGTPAGRRYGYRKLGRNTYLEPRSSGAFAVRLHGTDIITIHRDGTFTLRTGGWWAVTTKDRINAFGPARIYSERGTWCIWSDTDPKTPPKIQKCRACKGTGSNHLPAHFQHTRRTSADPDDWSLSAYERVLVPARDVPCYNCGGSGQRDYGSKPMPVIFDGRSISVDSSGSVIGADRYERLHESPEVTKARQEKLALEQLAKKQAETQAWITGYKLKTTRTAVVMFKAVNHVLYSSWGEHYPIGGKVTAKDYAPTENCGAGLHFGPTVSMARSYFQNATRFLACAVNRKTLVILGDKAKAQSCRVLYEVDENGNKLA